MSHSRWELIVLIAGIVVFALMESLANDKRRG